MKMTNKKFLSAIAAMATTLCMTVTGNAFYEDLDLNSNENHNEYEFSTNQNDNFEGRDPESLRGTVSVSVTHYYQDSQTWSNDYLGTSSNNSNDTIGTAGCLVTSVSMYYKFLESSSLDPGAMNTTLKNAGLNTDDLALDNIRDTFGWSDEHRTFLTTTSFASARSIIISQVNAGRPVIVGLKKNNKPHFVVAYGYDNNSQYVYIKDPYYANNYTSLNTYCNNGWIINNLRAFSN